MSNGNSLVDFVYSDMERFFFQSPCLCFFGARYFSRSFPKNLNKAEEVTKGSLLPRKHSVRIEF